MFFLGIVIAVGLYAFTQKGNEKMVVQKEQNTESGVPLPRKEDIIRVFFNLIDEGRVSSALIMMSPKMIGDESSKQAWGVQFNAFENIKVVSLEPAGNNRYKVVLETKMKPEAGLAESIPFYGYGDGQFIRFIELEQIDKVWKIREIATGP